MRKIEIIGAITISLAIGVGVSANNHILDLEQELISKNAKIKSLSNENNDLSQKVSTLLNDNKKLSYQINDISFKKVGFNPDDLTQKSNVGQKQLELIFKNNEKYNGMIGLESSFINAEREFGVNAIFLLGIINQESNLGKSRRSIEDNNLCGYAIYNNNSKKKFKSKDDCIVAMAKTLKNNYIDKGLNTVYDVGKVWCPNDEWSKPVIRLSNIIKDDINNL